MNIVLFWKSGYSVARVNGKEIELRDWKEIKLARYKNHDIDILIDKLKVNDENISRLFEGIERALKIAQGIVLIKCGKKEAI